MDQGEKSLVVRECKVCGKVENKRDYGCRRESGKRRGSEEHIVESIKFMQAHANTHERAQAQHTENTYLLLHRSVSVYNV